MNTAAALLSLTLEASNVVIPEGLAGMRLFTYFQSEAIALLQDDDLAVTHFGMVPDNGAEGIDALLTDGTLFRFDASPELLKLDAATAPHLVKQAFLAVVSNRQPVYCAVLEELGTSKKETTLVFQF